MNGCFFVNLPKILQKDEKDTLSCVFHACHDGMFQRKQGFKGGGVRPRLRPKLGFG